MKRAGDRGHPRPGQSDRRSETARGSLAVATGVSKPNRFHRFCNARGKDS
jgi:hypothetical protein